MDAFQMAEYESEKFIKRNKVGLFVTGIIGTAACGLVFLTVPFLLPAVRKFCLPYVPATENQIKNVLALLSKQKGCVIDLGSGDGRIVIETAKLGYPSFGVELNPLLVAYSRFKATSLGVSSLAKFKRQDLWNIHLAKFDNVIIFGVQEMMPQLERKLSDELRPRSCVITCRFPLPKWKALQTVEAGIDSVWLYRKE